MTQTLCDGCGKERDIVRKTRISITGEKGMVADLCSTCLAPLDKLLARVAANRTSRLGIADLPLVTLEDIEREKEGARRSQASKRGHVTRKQA